jgi:type IV pilus assembly protein PilC
MNDFDYLAKTKNGEITKGVVEADSDSSAAKVLMARDLFPVKITPKEKGGFSLFSKVGSKDKVFLVRQLATTISAGLPISQALETLESQTNNKKLKDLIGQVSNDVEGGANLSQAFGRFPKVFSKVDITLIQTGETTGTLDKALERLAQTMENDFRVTRKIRSAMIYPAFIGLVAVGVVGFMTVYIIPKMGDLYETFNAKLPLITRIILAISTGLTKGAPVVVVIIIAAFFAYRAYSKTNQGRHVVDGMKLKIPVIKTFLMNIYLARFTRTLAGLIGAGVSVLEALEIVSRSTGNVLYADVISASITQVKAGVPLSTPLKESDLFPPIVSQMVRVGEQTGEMDGMLNNLADYYEEEVDNFVKSITSIMEPVMIVVLGAIVMVIMLGIMLPVYSMGKVVK